MARNLRLEYPGAIYHVMNRGDHREPIFRNDVGRCGFLDTQAEFGRKTAWQVHAGDDPDGGVAGEAVAPGTRGRLTYFLCQLERTTAAPAPH